MRRSGILDIAHHRLTLFWVLALIGLSAPWLMVEIDLGNWHGSIVSERSCTVASIHDGDTLRAICEGERLQIRLYCIDTPEMAQAPWGRESRDHLRIITPVRIILRTHDTDRYGRTVGEILTPEGDSLNLRMVRDGQAAVYRRYCSDPLYRRLESEAKALGRGIWASPGDHQVPWEYRRRSS
jgi:endonuclease YncB( thermonuclease family)